MAYKRTWTDEYVRDFVTRSRAAQGLPPQVEDEAFYDNLAVHLTAGLDVAMASPATGESSRRSPSASAGDAIGAAESSASRDPKLARRSVTSSAASDRSNTA